MMIKTASYFRQLQEINTLNLISCSLLHFSYFSILIWQKKGLTVVLTECSWATIMTIPSDGCTRRHMSVLSSSNVQLKLLLCVNKDDRKWQFGSSNQECHSQLRPLPAPDTSHGQRGHGSDSSFSLSFLLSPLSSGFQDILFQCHLDKTQQSRRRQNDVQKTRARATAAHFLKRSNKTWGLSCQIILTPCVKIPATSSWSRVADVLSLLSSSGWNCQDLLLKGTEDGTEGTN